MYEIILVQNRDDKVYWIDSYNISSAEHKKHEEIADDFNKKSISKKIYTYQAMSDVDAKEQILRLHDSIDCKWEYSKACALTKDFFETYYDKKDV